MMGIIRLTTLLATDPAMAIISPIEECSGMHAQEQRQRCNIGYRLTRRRADQTQEQKEGNEGKKKKIKKESSDITLTRRAETSEIKIVRDYESVPYMLQLRVYSNSRRATRILDYVGQLRANKRPLSGHPGRGVLTCPENQDFVQHHRKGGSLLYGAPGIHHSFLYYYPAPSSR